MLPPPRLSSGVFNSLLAPGCQGTPTRSSSLRITSWNCRALFCRSDKRRRRKIDKLTRIAGNADIILLQEVHGGEFVLDLLLSSLEKNFLIFHSFIDHATGGIITAISKKHTPRETSLEHMVWVQGRVSRLEIVGLQSSLVVWNIHNFNIPSAGLRDASAKICDDSKNAALKPTEKMVIAMGDVNFNRQDLRGKSYFLPTVSDTSVPTQDRMPRHGQASFEAALVGLIEVFQDLATHCNVRDGTGSCIDGSFLSSPSWALLNICWQMSDVDAQERTF